MMKYVLNWPQDETRMKINVRNYSLDEKERLLSYMKSFEPVLAGGSVYDVVEKKSVGLENVSFEDDEYIWETRDIYHIEKYNMAVSDSFLLHVFKSAI